MGRRSKPHAVPACFRQLCRFCLPTGLRRALVQNTFAARRFGTADRANKLENGEVSRRRFLILRCYSN